MKKSLLLTVAIVAMATIDANAQSCGDNSTYGTQGPCASGSVCGCQSGRSDCAGPSCVNLQTNNNNCGSLGNSCNVGGGETCQRGTCECGWDDGCGGIGGGGIGPLQQSKIKPRMIALKNNHDDFAVAIASLRRQL